MAEIINFAGQNHGKRAPASHREAHDTFYGKPTKHLFQLMDGREFEGEVPSGEDVEDVCCKMSADLGVPVKCVPKIIETSSGKSKGEIIV